MTVWKVAITIGRSFHKYHVYYEVVERPRGKTSPSLIQSLPNLVIVYPSTADIAVIIYQRP